MKKDWKVTYFNKAYFLDNFEDYGIDYVFYIYSAKKIVNEIGGNINQKTLF